MKIFFDFEFTGLHQATTWTIQRESPGITLRAVLTALRAQRRGWHSLEQIMSEN